MRMPKRSVREVNRLIRLPAGSAAARCPPPAKPAPPIKSTITSTWQPHWARIPNPSRRGWKSPPRKYNRRRTLCYRTARTRLQDSAPGKPLILLGLNPGAEYGPAKRWPAESFAAVAREVSRKIGNCVWLAFGGAGDWQLCNDIARLAGGGVLNLAGKTSLRQLMALLKLCRVVLTNDTGPMHVAAALGTPVVVPFGSTSPELTGPGLPGDPRHQLLQVRRALLALFPPRLSH